LAANPETGSGGAGPCGASANPDEEDHYTLLGVPFSATSTQIDQAYRRAMKRAHPDRQHQARRAEAEELARRLNAAYAVLSNPIKRQAYDRTIRQQVIQDQIMRRYVGGFQTVDERPSAARVSPRPEPTAAERRERSRNDRQAAFVLLALAVGFTVLILVAILFGSVLSSLFGGTM
jgi:curved DNA-binding protein CbpA